MLHKQPFNLLPSNTRVHIARQYLFATMGSNYPGSEIGSSNRELEDVKEQENGLESGQ